MRLSVSQVRAVLNKLVGGSALTISAATNASPSVATSTAHGLVAGDVVYIVGATGLTNLNGVRTVATVPTANTLTFTDFFTGSAVNGNGTFGGTVTMTRINSALVPGDAHDLVDTMNGYSNARGPFAFKNRAAETSVQTIIGA